MSAPKGPADPAHLMIARAVRRHEHDVQSWVRQVRAASDTRDAARRAAHPPVMPAIVRNYGVGARNAERRARASVQAELDRRIAALDADSATAREVLGLLRGHWPDLHAALSRRRRTPRP